MLPTNQKLSFFISYSSNDSATTAKKSGLVTSWWTKSKWAWFNKSNLGYCQFQTQNFCKWLMDEWVVFGELNLS